MIHIFLKSYPHICCSWGKQSWTSWGEPKLSTCWLLELSKTYWTPKKKIASFRYLAVRCSSPCCVSVVWYIHPVCDYVRASRAGIHDYGVIPSHWYQIWSDSTTFIFEPNHRFRRFSRTGGRKYRFQASKTHQEGCTSSKNSKDLGFGVI
jgi:hypothetical protein